VTTPASGELAEHELPLGAGKISFFAAYRARGGAARVAPLRVRAVPLERDLARLARELGGGPPELFVADGGAGAVAAGRLQLDGLELLVYATELYPSLPPVVLATHAGGTEQLPLAWPLEVAEEERLAAALGPFVAPPGPYRKAFGPRGGPALTLDAERARLAGWTARFTGADPAAAAEAVREALFARSAGLLSPTLRERSALVAGCGSVGSYLAEQLVRSGVGGVALLDPDVVEAANLSRSAYAVSDVGRPKVEALAGRLLQLDPALRLALDAVRLDALSPADLDARVRAADLVVAATDDPAAQRALDRFAYARGRPALFVGLYAGAQGGEVVMTVPGRTACYLCATRARHAAERAAGRVGRDVDYGTGRLAGEMALGADIHHVASAAVKLGLALLLGEGAGASLRAAAEAALAEGASYLTLSTVPRYWFYPQLFGDTPGQGAFQAVWLSPARSDDCPVCGPAERRVDPLDVPLRAPSRAAFEEALAGSASARPRSQ
jgi:molybdopterin/thiamine biosynthesis adenylyltransferase